MASPETLTLIRHGESARNQQGATQGQDPLYQAFLQSYEKAWDSENTRMLAKEFLATLSDDYTDHEIPLSSVGEEQARRVAMSLGSRVKLPSIVFVSPFKRTVDTLDMMVEGWPALGEVPVIEDDRLVEQDRGLQTTFKNWRVFEVLHPEEKVLKDAQGMYWYRYPNGESLDDVGTRGEAWLNETSESYPGEDIMVVTHVSPILGFRGRIEGLTPDEILRMQAHEGPINAGTTFYQAERGRLALEAYNVKLY